MPRDDEESWIFGNSKKAEEHFHVSSRTTGPTAGGGRGTGRLGTVKVGMLLIPDAGFRRKVSMLPAVAIHGRPTEFVKSTGVRIIEVLRENAR